MINTKIGERILVSSLVKMAPTELIILKLLKEINLTVVPYGKPSKKSQWKKLSLLKAMQVKGCGCLQKHRTSYRIQGKSIWMLYKTYYEKFTGRTKGKKRIRADPRGASVGKCNNVCVHVSFSKSTGVCLCWPVWPGVCTVQCAYACVCTYT